MATSSASINGIGSGLDIDGIVSSLVSLRQIPINKIQNQITIQNARKSGLQEVSNLLTSVRSLASGLREASLWEDTPAATKRDVAVADPGVLTASSVGNNANPGSYTINVLSLAKANQWQSQQFVAASDDVLHIKVGDREQISIQVKAGDDAAAITDKINSLVGKGVVASAADGKLTLTSSSTGAANTLQITSDGSLAADMGITEIQAGADATYTVNGGQVKTSASNRIGALINGVSATLVAVGETTITVIEVDDPSSTGVSAAEKVAGQLQKLVDAYNAAMKGANERIKQEKVKNPATNAELVAGALRNDSSLRAVIGDLRSWRYHEVSGAPANFNSFDDIGIGTMKASGADANMGLLQFDREKFIAAYNEDPNAVRKLIDNYTGDASTEGLAEFIDRRVGALVDGERGLLSSGIQGVTNRVESLQDQSDLLTERLNRYRDSLKAQFARLDTMLGTINAQNSAIYGQLASWVAGARPF